ncbi:MAG: hypothetical protein KGJ84_10920 [Elusimicrobia bacterium]|nr:hypothetical protein [Elusimicrobiota bacterium]
MINDETLELLSSYLDGAMTEAERLALEARLAASADLRRELESLRAASMAVKNLPREPLPPGFLARLQARRARGDAPRQDWVFLPPAMRPVALALSCGVVALLVWDKVTVPPPEPLRHSENEAKVAATADGPVAPFDVSRRAAGLTGARDASQDLDGSGTSVIGPVPEDVQKGEVLPRLTDQIAPPAAPAAAAKSAATGSVSGIRGGSGRAAGRPLLAAGAAGGGTTEPVLTDRTRITMTEEERSARNEQMFDYIESQKKKMGIAQVLPHGARSPRPEAAAAPALSAPTPNLLKNVRREGLAAADATFRAQAAGPGRLAPDAGLVFSDARSLGSTWVLLGFPGIPPTTDFSAGRLILIKPSATKIVSVTVDAGAVNVAYRSLLPDETADPVKDRVAPIPSEPRTVLLFDVSPP